MTTFWEWFIGALFCGYALFWLGVYFGERRVLKVWLPSRSFWRGLSGVPPGTARKP